MSKKVKLPHFLTVPRMACALLSLVMIGLQFLPFWDMGAEVGKLSIADVLWFPHKHVGIDQFFESVVVIDPTVNPFVINQVILVPVFVFAMAVVGFVLCFIMKSKGYTVAPLICGLLTVVGYLVRPELKLGAGWYFHLIPAIIMIAFVVMDLMGVFNKKAE